MKFTLLSLLFIARITIPLGGKIVYDDVQRVVVGDGGFSYHLFLSDGRDVYAPVMFTVIEENKK